jgi:multiple sugar transport system permease protein
MGTQPTQFQAKDCAYLFVAPFLLLFIAFIVAPLAYALYMSLFRDTLWWPAVYGARLYQGGGDAKFWGGVWNLVLGIVQVPIMLAWLCCSRSSSIADMFT